MNEKIRKSGSVLILFGMILIVTGMTGCSKQQSAKLNNRMNATTASSMENEESQEQNGSQAQNSSQGNTESSTEIKSYGTPDATGRVGYQCDINADKNAFDGTADIVVGNNLYTTQINDWYMNFDKYKGKTVEIEGYYIDDNAPYTFVGRYGPACPYCNGGYVSFEFYTQEDLTQLKSAHDWIKIKGILRNGEDSNGIFYYIEVLSLEKMDKVGLDTVTN